MQAGAQSIQVIIIGGGISGLSLALSLHQVGIVCRLYEAVPTLAPPPSATASICSPTRCAS